MPHLFLTELHRALREINDKGYYNADARNINYRRLLHAEQELLKITEKEHAFLQLACSHKTYKQIAAEMGISERTEDGNRESLLKDECAKPCRNGPGSNKKGICKTFKLGWQRKYAFTSIICIAYPDIAALSQFQF